MAAAVAGDGDARGVGGVPELGVGAAMQQAFHCDCCGALTRDWCGFWVGPRDVAIYVTVCGSCRSGDE